jgi:NFACT protein RNA binding domain
MPDLQQYTVCPCSIVPDGHRPARDCRFHVDKLSSAHVYLRLPLGKTLDDIPDDLLEECCQLVKQNSIEGCKQNNVDIVYTLWSNLKKTADMAVGQVSFHKPKEVRKCKVEKKKNDILNRINKTKIEAFPDLAAQREQYDRERASAKKQELVVRRHFATRPRCHFATSCAACHVQSALAWLPPVCIGV